MQQNVGSWGKSRSGKCTLDMTRMTHSGSRLCVAAVVILFLRRALGDCGEEGLYEAQGDDGFYQSSALRRCFCTFQSLVQQVRQRRFRVNTL